MNRFRNKKKAKEEPIFTPRASHESDSPTPFRLFGKAKKSQEEEPKPEIDLENALPPRDDFRTSLLMTGLSARFSMLREQDDPHTKIGKASDDSVLLPRRQSRLMDFGLGASSNGLSDIAEVESIRKDMPFARMDSYHSADGSSTSGSVMDRAKPGEGNNLFGGRQKVYKLASGTSSSKTLGPGGMSGRVLYDDDVSQSAFQKWRQAEKTKLAFDDDQDQTSIDLTRSESPLPTGYNSKRETNSTTSSTPSISRNSTAATSIMSQPASSAKDWQSTAAGPNSAAGTPHLERTSTRTWRLYETGLNHDLQEQQSSALSRIDTLSRQRNFGSRTPDLQNGPSPTSSLFSDRFNERRILAKGSAPNLRSASPPTAGSPIPAMDLGITNPEPKPLFGGTPPLSPPVSEGEESSILPGDRGKATAMGLFQKPLHSYDESRYAQRQLQLQQGRETPTNRLRTESNASYTTSRSRSSSSAQRFPVEKPEPIIQTEPTVKEEESCVSFYDDSATSSQDDNAKSSSASQDMSRRPADRDHPALRESSVPTPSTGSSGDSTEPSPVPDRPAPAIPEVSVESQTSPQDSPTLPSSSGLSGMVRQHLRTDSTTSSIYGPGPHTSHFSSRFPLDPYDNDSMADLGIMANPWEVQSPDWRNSTFSGSGSGNNQAAAEQKEQPAPQPRQRLPSDSQNASERNTASSTEMEGEHDEFASQLADGARRVRERLTSYVESDRDSRSLSPNPVDRVREPSLPRPNALGILRQKTSRGSLIDRNRENRQDSQHSKAIKMLGLASSTISSAPSPSKSSFEEKEPPSPVHDERHKPGFPRSETTPVLPSQETGKDKEDESMHAGLRAFRQARKQLLEAQKSPSNVPTAPGQMLNSMASPIVGPPASRTAPIPRQRSASRERRPPPITYQQRTPSEEPRLGNGAGRAERDRSGSEASNGDRPHRPARLRTGTGSSPQEDRERGLTPNGPPSGRAPMLQSPGLPGTNIRRSPHMPPQPYPKPLDRSASSGNLVVQSRRGPDSGQPSPVSPMAPMPSPSIPVSQSTPAFAPPRRPSAPPVPSPNSEAPAVSRLDDSMRRVVRKKDISEPTFVSSTSRVPTVALPETSESRSRSGSRARSGSILGAASSTPNLHATMVAHSNAPPLPPINPKRRNMIGNMMSRRGEDDGGASSPLAPPPQISGEHGSDSHSAFSVSDDEDGPGSQRRRLRKTISEANGMNMRARLTRGNSPPNMPSPKATTGGVNNGSMPGGMI